MAHGSSKTLLLAVGLQSSLLPQIGDVDNVVANSLLLLKAAKLLGQPTVFVELASAECGNTMTALKPFVHTSLQSHAFDATRAQRFHDILPVTVSNILIVGAEAHVFVMQTGFGLLKMGRSVAIVRDAVGSRRTPEKQAALGRLAQRGAEIVTAEMTVLEWLGAHDASGCQDAWNLVNYTRPSVDILESEPSRAPAEPAMVSEPQKWLIGPLLRRSRLDQSLTLAQLAARTNCSLSQLSKIETGKAIPSLPVLFKLSQVLGMDMNSFLSVPPNSDTPGSQET